MPDKRKKIKVVILQPMFFPWAGVFEQIRLADIFVHYDDVQYPRGKNFNNRVQIKMPKGTQWLTVPVLTKHKGLQLIKDVKIDETTDWRQKHLKALQQNYCHQPFFNEMFGLVKSVYSKKTGLISELNIFALEKIADYFKLSPRFHRSSDYSIKSKSTQRLLDLVRLLKGNIYITGHGAANYLDHQLFERTGIEVEYMDYQKIPYSQPYGDFTPYVSILDLIASVGKAGQKYIRSGTIPWKDFLNKGINKK